VSTSISRFVEIVLADEAPKGLQGAQGFRVFGVQHRAPARHNEPKQRQISLGHTHVLRTFILDDHRLPGRHFCGYRSVNRDLQAFSEEQPVEDIYPGRVQSGTGLWLDSCYALLRATEADELARAVRRMAVTIFNPKIHRHPVKTAASNYPPGLDLEEFRIVEDSRSPFNRTIRGG
jgi:hypothetical protein